MMRASYKRRISHLATSLNYKNTSIYLVGSLKKSSSDSFNSKLSDVDLLVVPICDSLDDYVSHFEQAISMAATLNRSDQIYDVFLLTNKIANLHYSCLSVYAGLSYPLKEDRIFGSGIHEDSYVSPFNATILRDFYAARGLSFCEEYINLLPVTDTAKSRKTAKALLRGLKLLLCSLTGKSELHATELKLSNINSFVSLAPFLEDFKSTDLQKDIWLSLDEALDGDNVEWTQWIAVQEEIAGFLMNARKLVYLESDRWRAADTLTRILRDALIVDIKNIICETVEDRRTEMIDYFLNNSMSLVARLALNGVETLKDFSHPNTPILVQQSFEVIIKNLKGQTVNVNSLAATAALLEYAFKEGAIYYGQKYGK